MRTVDNTLKTIPEINPFQPVADTPRMQMFEIVLQSAGEDDDE